jgi:hypothetical protein
VCVLKRVHELVLNKIKNVILTFFFPVFLMDVMGEKKNNNRLKRTALKQKKKKHMHTGKELEAH